MLNLITIIRFFFFTSGIFFLKFITANAHGNMYTYSFWFNYMCSSFRATLPTRTRTRLGRAYRIGEVQLNHYTPVHRSSRSRADYLSAFVKLKRPTIHVAVFFYAGFIWICTAFVLTAVLPTNMWRGRSPYTVLRGERSARYNYTMLGIDESISYRELSHRFDLLLTRLRYSFMFYNY